jgi:hypothetical protein
MNFLPVLALILAQQEGAAARAILETAAIATGGDHQARLRSSEVGQPADRAGELLDNRGPAQPGVFLDAPSSQWLETGDVDNDGDTDVVVLPREFFQQSGAVGTFAKDPTLFRAGGALFDADGDGDLEFYVSSQGGIFVPTNAQDRLLRNALR